MLKLTFLGTSAGIPTRHRNVTGLAIELINPFANKHTQSSKRKKPWVLIDCGEATQHQILRTKLSSHQLQAICITHVHGDHCYGLPGLLASMAMSGRQQPLTIIAPEAIRQFIEVIKLTTDLYLPFAIEFISSESLFASKEANTSNSVTITLSPTHSLQFELIKLSHRVASYAYSLQQKAQTITLDIDKLTTDGIKPTANWGKLQLGQDVVLENGELLKASEYTKQTQRSLKIVVAGDNDNPQLLTRAVQDAELLVHEATYTQQVADKIMQRGNNMQRGKAFDPMHTTAKNIAQFASQVKLKNLILTHFSARYQPFDNPDSKQSNMSEIRLEAEQFYPGNMWLAHDFAQYEVSATGVKRLGANMD